MKGFMDFLDERTVDMGVNLGSNNRTVAKHFLHGAKISPPPQADGLRRYGERYAD